LDADEKRLKSRELDLIERELDLRERELELALAKEERIGGVQLELKRKREERLQTTRTRRIPRSPVKRRGG